MSVGLCMIKSTKPYRKELKCNYDIDILMENKKAMEDYFRLITVRVLLSCPVY